MICAQVSFEECPEKEAVKLLPSISAGYVRLEANGMKELAALYASQKMEDRVASHVQNCLWKTYVGKQTAAGKRIKCVTAAVRRRTKQHTKLRTEQRTKQRTNLRTEQHTKHRTEQRTEQRTYTEYRHHFK